MGEKQVNTVKHIYLRRNCCVCVEGAGVGWGGGVGGGGSTQYSMVFTHARAKPSNEDNSSAVEQSSSLCCPWGNCECMFQQVNPATHPVIQS